MQSSSRGGRDIGARVWMLGALLGCGAAGSDAGGAGAMGLPAGTGFVSSGDSGGGMGATGAAGTNTTGTGAAGRTATGAAGTTGCRTLADCEGMGLRKPHCLRPDELYSAPAVCGAPQWCGQCTCPPQEGGGPIGYWEPCESDAQCPAQVMPVVPEANLASVCVDNRCQQCGKDSDCAPSEPHCAQYTIAMGNQPLRLCAACADDSHCSGALAHCSPGLLPNKSDRGTCVECTLTSTCAEGTCVMGRCVAQCESDDACGPLQMCDEHARCVPRACSSAADCPAQHQCTPGRNLCERIACTSDDSCEGSGWCPSARYCYEELGRCIETFVMGQP